MQAFRYGLARTSQPKLVLGSALFLLFLLAVIRAFLAPDQHDQSWYLLAAQRLLSGERIYGPSIVETNPPFIIWFSALPVLLARLFPIGQTAALRLIVVLMIIAVTMWCVQLLRRSAMGRPSGLAGLLGVAILLIELLPSQFDFAQREHLFTIFSLPYILAAITGAESRITFAERCALGVAAGLAVSFKPQEVIILIAFELVLAIGSRSLRRVISPEVLGLIATVAVYLSLVRVLTPEYQSKVVPILFQTYWAYGDMGITALTLGLRKLYLAGGVIGLVCIAMRRHVSCFRAVLALCVCGLGASVAYYIQGVNWSYHRLPCWQYLALAGCWLVIELCLRVSAQYASKLRFGFGVALCLVVVEGGVFTIPLRTLAVRHSQTRPTPLDQYLAQYPPATSVFIFSTSVVPFAPVFAHKLTWASGFPCLWMMPAVVMNENPSFPRGANFKQMSSHTVIALRKLQLGATTADLNRWRPTVILVERCSAEHSCQGLVGSNFDMISWFLQSPDFAAVWRHYQRQPGLPGFDVYTRRVD